jgi:fructokinase
MVRLHWLWTKADLQLKVYPYILFNKYSQDVKMKKKPDWVAGGIEAGGTKVVCLLGTGPDEIVAEKTLPTTTPDETLEKIISFFKTAIKRKPLLSMGIASFGPIDPHPGSDKFGYITNTPKPGWSDTNIVGELKKEFPVPIGFNTDVNGAAFGEFCWGAGLGLDSILYLTIGTGIGGGAVIGRKIIHGLLHPEMGHIKIPHDKDLDPFEGICPYHSDCFEGLACGPAIAARWGQPPKELHPDHQAWELEADYIAMALVNYTYVLSPQRLVLGGGVMKQEHLYPKIKKKFLHLLNNYLQVSEILSNIDSYISPPALGDRSGVLGALALGLEQLPDKFTHLKNRMPSFGRHPAAPQIPFIEH